MPVIVDRLPLLGESDGITVLVEDLPVVVIAPERLQILGDYLAKLRCSEHAIIHRHHANSAVNAPCHVRVVETARQEGRPPTPRRQDDRAHQLGHHHRGGNRYGGEGQELTAVHGQPSDPTLRGLPSMARYHAHTPSSLSADTFT